MNDKEVRRERRKLRRAVVRTAVAWSVGQASEPELLKVCQELRMHETAHPNSPAEE